jgi:hypothetical protein
MKPCILLEFTNFSGDLLHPCSLYRRENLHLEDRSCVLPDKGEGNLQLIEHHIANEIFQTLQKVYLRSQNACLTPSAAKADVCVWVVVTYGARGAGYRFGSGRQESCSLLPAWTWHTGGRTGGWLFDFVSLNDVIFFCLNCQHLNFTFNPVYDLSFVAVIECK